MAFSVSSLTDYVNEQSLVLLTALQFEGKTASFANIQTGVKSSTALQVLTSTVYFQDGDSDCAFNASGDTAFTQRVLATKGVKIQDTLCPRALQTKWTQLLLKSGQKYTEADIPKMIVDDLIKQIVRKNETMDWVGNTANVNDNKNYQGLKTIIAAASGTVTASASTWNATNARAIMKTIVAGIPAAQKGDPNTKIWLGYDVAETYRQVLMDANLYHYPTSKDQVGLFAEGSVHEIIAVHGLDGLAATTGATNPFIFAIDPARNFYLGVDMEGEEETVDMWESKDDQNVKYSFRYRRGWQVAFPSEIVEYANT